MAVADIASQLRHVSQQQQQLWDGAAGPVPTPWLSPQYAPANEVAVTTAAPSNGAAPARLRHASRACLSSPVGPRVPVAAAAAGGGCATLSHPEAAAGLIVAASERTRCPPSSPPPPSPPLVQNHPGLTAGGGPREACLEPDPVSAHGVPARARLCLPCLHPDSPGGGLAEGGGGRSNSYSPSSLPAAAAALPGCMTPTRHRSCSSLPGPLPQPPPSPPPPCARWPSATPSLPPCASAAGSPQVRAAAEALAVAPAAVAGTGMRAGADRSMGPEHAAGRGSRPRLRGTSAATTSTTYAPGHAPATRPAPQWLDLEPERTHSGGQLAAALMWGDTGSSGGGWRGGDHTDWEVFHPFFFCWSHSSALEGLLLMR